MSEKFRGQFVRVRNLDQYQHYKDRNPPWVKLHAKVLEDYDFGQLPDASKAHALLLLPLAARLGNKIPADPDWIAARIQARSKIDLELLIRGRFLEAEQDASAAPAECPQGADSERETEAEGEKRESKAEMEWRVSEVWTAHLKQWRGFLHDVNGISPPQEPKLTAEIRTDIVRALREFDGDFLTPETRLEWTKRSKARAAGIGIFLDPFLAGQHKDNDAKNGGKRYLEHWRPWKLQRGKADPVERFAELYFLQRELTDAA